MKRFLWLVVISLSVAPAFCQGSEESILRELGMGALFAESNLALRQMQAGDDPVQQLKRFFNQAKLPLSSAQQKQLTALVDIQVKALQSAGQNEEAIRLANQDFNRKSNEVFTPEQRAELRRYRTEQIMMRGGFPALILTLENAQAPLTPEQEKEVEAAYSNFNRDLEKLPRDSKGIPNRADLDKLEGQALGRVVRLLTPAQRKALMASRSGSLAKIKQ